MWYCNTNSKYENCIWYFEIAHVMRNSSKLFGAKVYFQHFFNFLTKNFILIHISKLSCSRCTFQTFYQTSANFWKELWIGNYSVFSLLCFLTSMPMRWDCSLVKIIFYVFCSVAWPCHTDHYKKDSKVGNGVLNCWQQKI